MKKLWIYIALILTLIFVMALYLIFLKESKQSFVLDGHQGIKKPSVIGKEKLSIDTVTTKFSDTFKELDRKSSQEQLSIYKDLSRNPFGVLPSQIETLLRYGLISKNLDIKVHTVNYLTLVSAMHPTEVIDFFSRNDDSREVVELMIVSQDKDERLSGFALTNVGTEKSNDQATNLLISSFQNEKGSFERIEMIRGLRYRMVNARVLIEPVLIEEVVNGIEDYRLPIEAALLLKDYDNPPIEIIEPVIKLIQHECCYASIGLLQVLDVFNAELVDYKEQLVIFRKQLELTSRSIVNRDIRLKYLNKIIKNNKK